MPTLRIGRRSSVAGSLLPVRMCRPGAMSGGASLHQCNPPLTAEVMTIGGPDHPYIAIEVHQTPVLRPNVYGRDYA
jgi:hypothetical protein